MKIAEKIARVLLGLVYTAFSLMFFLNMMPDQPPQSGAAAAFGSAMFATGYMFAFIKVTELVCGLMLLSGFKSQLATVMILPVTLNIFMFHAMLDPSTVGISVVLLVLNLFLGYCYRSHYAGMLNAGNAWKS